MQLYFYFILIILEINIFWYIFNKGHFFSIGIIFTVFIGVNCFLFDIFEFFASKMFSSLPAYQLNILGSISKMVCGSFVISKFWFIFEIKSIIFSRNLFQIRIFNHKNCVSAINAFNYIRILWMARKCDK